MAYLPATIAASRTWFRRIVVHSSALGVFGYQRVGSITHNEPCVIDPCPRRRGTQVRKGMAKRKKGDNTPTAVTPRERKKILRTEGKDKRW